MAQVARLRETCRRMVWIGGFVVISQVAGSACSVGQLVVIVDMALTALCAGEMEPGQRPAGGGVIEFAIGPQHRVMAVLARGGEAQLDVVDGSRRRVVVVLVARYASCVGEIVVVVDVALAALGSGVCAGERESGSSVIEFSVGPQHRVMAVLARGGETQLDVVDGSRRRVVVVLVATD